MNPWLYYGSFVQIGTYPVVIVLAFCACTVILRREAQRSRLPVRQVMDAALVGIVVGAVCARLFHAIVEQPAVFWERPLLLFSPFAGWTYYGGFVGGLVAVAAVARAHGVSAWRMLDVFAVAIPLGQALARLGCLAAGCCHGRLADWPLGVTVPWAITIDAHGMLPPELLAVPIHPAPLYLSLMNLAVFVGLSRMRAQKPAGGVVFAGLLIAYGLGRAVLDAFRGDIVRGLWFSGTVSTAQLVSAGVCAVGVYVLWRRTRSSS